MVRFELPDGLHIFGPPVPDGIIATQRRIAAQAGFQLKEQRFPATPIFALPNGEELNVWRGTVELLHPFYATEELASECRQLDVSSIDINVTVQHPAFTHYQCLLLGRETLSLCLDFDVIDIPAIGMHKGHGQRKGNCEAHLR